MSAVNHDGVPAAAAPTTTADATGSSVEESPDPRWSGMSEEQRPERAQWAESEAQRRSELHFGAT